MSSIRLKTIGVYSSPLFIEGGDVVIESLTDYTATDTGSLQVKGGVYIAKNLRVEQGL